MGMSVLIPLAIAAAGAGVEDYNQNETEKKQNNVLADSLRQQSQNKQKAQQQTSQLLNKFAASNDAQIRSDATAKYLQQLAANRGNMNADFAAPGATSSAFAADTAAAKQNLGQFGNTVAGQLAAIQAPGLQRVAEGQDVMRYNEALAPLREKSAEQQWLAQLRLRGIQPDPWLNAFGSLAQAYGMGAAGNAIGGAGMTGYGNGTGVSSPYGLFGIAG